MQHKLNNLIAVADPARRAFFRNLGKLGIGAAAGVAMGGPANLAARTITRSAQVVQDTANQIFSTALMAEDLMTTFYYNGLIGGVIQHPSLAGPGGSALLPSSPANVQNIDSLRAAFAQEISHAKLMRSLGNLGTGPTTDANQVFYFPANTFTALDTFYAYLASLEAELIGTYLIAIREFSALAAQTASSVPDGPAGGPYSAGQLQYFTQVAASIMGVEAEHRVLGGVLIGELQPNNLAYEQSDSLQTVFTGSGSVNSALAPFLSSTTGPAYSLQVALSAATTLGLTSGGTPPSYLAGGGTPGPGSQATIAASPNPIPVKAGQVVGATTISWSAPAASVIQVRVNSPNGPIFTSNFNTGSMTTGPWVPNGMTFYLQDAGNGNPTLGSNTLAAVTVNLASS